MAADGGGGGGGDGDENSSEAGGGGGRICRFCFVGDDDEDPTSTLSSARRRGGAPQPDVDSLLISPCHCSGTQEWVHVGCLRQWQRARPFVHTSLHHYSHHVIQAPLTQLL